MKIQFSKMSGAGNDFVVIDNRTGLIQDGPALAKTVCDRRWGIGADGLLLLEKSHVADYSMKYYNADGSYGGMCGNGGRCLAQFAFVHSIAGSSHKFEALDFLYEASIEDDRITLSMKPPSDFRMNIVLPLRRRHIKAHFVDTGSPHVVIPVSQFRKTLDALNVLEIGRSIRQRREFMPGGANVNFIQQINANSIKIRTYERGVEDETLACGTGSIASAIIANKVWKLGPPVVVVPASGVNLTVDFAKAGMTYSETRLSGPAKIIFTGAMDV